MAPAAGAAPARRHVVGEPCEGVGANKCSGNLKSVL